MNAHPAFLAVRIDVIHLLSNLEKEKIIFLGIIYIFLVLLDAY